MLGALDSAASSARANGECAPASPSLATWPGLVEETSRKLPALGTLKSRKVSLALVAGGQIWPSGLSRQASSTTIFCLAPASASSTSSTSTPRADLLAFAVDIGVDGDEHVAFGGLHAVARVEHEGEGGVLRFGLELADCGGKPVAGEVEAAGPLAVAGDRVEAAGGEHLREALRVRARIVERLQLLIGVVADHQRHALVRRGAGAAAAVGAAGAAGWAGSAAVAGAIKPNRKMPMRKPMRISVSRIFPGAIAALHGF